MKAGMPGRFEALAAYPNPSLTEEEEAAAAEACAICGRVEEEFSIPALIWWVVVAICSVGSFCAGLILGSDQ